jgi:glycosyltransferase involved in cell wall biosynthesis
MLRLGVYTPPAPPISIRHYMSQVTGNLAALGVEIEFFTKDEALPEHVDLYWDPSRAGGTPPSRRLWNAAQPLVVTLHGVAPFVLPRAELRSSFSRTIRRQLGRIVKRWGWRIAGDRCAAIIAVSQFAKAEIVRVLDLPPDKVTPVYHGVDHDLFAPIPPHQAPAHLLPYLLHVSQYQPVKNLDRLWAAHKRIGGHRSRLICVIPGYAGREQGEGIEIVRDRRPWSELVGLYQDALGSVFPSLHESFGMPILEAMACGCPVITSNVTACPEVAGDAALLVNPHSVDEIAGHCARPCVSVGSRGRRSSPGAKARSSTSLCLRRPCGAKRFPCEKVK